MQATNGPSKSSLQVYCLGLLALTLTGCLSTGYPTPIALDTHPKQSIGDTFTLWSWNVAKREAALESEELQIAKPDILCVQEWMASYDPRKSLAGHEGFVGNSWRWPWGMGTGVATLSNKRMDSSSVKVISAPTREFLVTSSKASLLTTFPMGNGSKLLVVNVHALNMSAVTWGLNGQMMALAAEIAKHHGPVIACGDFNTWRKDRLEVVNRAFRSAGMKRIQVGGPHGQAHWVVNLLFGDRKIPIDHLFARGIRCDSAEFMTVKDSHVSDHNPVVATFTYPPSQE